MLSSTLASWGSEVRSRLAGRAGGVRALAWKKGGMGLGIAGWERYKYIICWFVCGRRHGRCRSVRLGTERMNTRGNRSLVGYRVHACG